MTELGAILLPVVPLLLLVSFLLTGRYPGCEAMVRLAERFAARMRARLVSHRHRKPRPPARRTAHGGLLLALALSGRAPPA